MEPQIIPMHPSSPPLLDDDGDGEIGSEDDEFEGFSVGPSFSSHGVDDSKDPSSSLRYSPPSMKPATHQSNSSFNKTVEQSQPTFTVMMNRQDDSESHVHLTNGYSGRNLSLTASAGGASCPQEETGFADFTVFARQAAHPWCCGLTPLVGIQERNSSRSSGEKICEDKQEVIMESEPKSHSASQANATTGVQEDGESDKDTKYGEEEIFSAPQTFSVCESASDASFCDDLSFDVPSADFEPNVSSLGSPEDQTDQDQTDDDEELENLGHLDSFAINDGENPRESKTGMSFYYHYQSATQDTSATSQSGTHTDDNLRDCDFGHHRDQDYVQTAGARVEILGNLPPSDSFADFCSAPTQEGGEELWAEFNDQRAQEERKSLTQSQEQVSSLKIDESTEEERVRHHGETRGNSCQVSVSSRVQQLLLSSFPEVKVPTVDSVKQMPSLDIILHDEHISERENEEAPDLYRRSQSIQRAMWPHQDLHSAAGLQFKWGGSHSNRTLLRCLGVDTKNIVFIGMEKQPVTVPAFASSLGMLEPTKDSVAAVCSSGHTAVTAQAPSWSQVTPDPSTGSGQEALPCSQQDLSSHGLSNPQDGTSPRQAPHFWGRK